MFAATNIYEALFPIHLFSKISGLCCFSINRRGYSSSIFGYMYSVFLAVSHLYISYNQFLYMTFHGDLLRMMIMKSSSIMNIFNTFVLILVGILNSKKVLEWIDEIHFFDNEMLVTMGISRSERSHKKIRIHSIIGCLIVILFGAYFQAGQIIFIKLEDFYGIELLTTTGTLLISTLLTSVTILQFSVMLLVVKERFSWINAELAKMKRGWNTNYSKLRKHGVESLSIKLDYEYNEKKLIRNLENLRQRYYRLDSLTQDLISFYALSILLCISQFFVSPLRYLITTMRILEKSREAGICPTLWTYFLLLGKSPVLCVLQLMFLSLLSSRTSKEARKAASILHSFEHTSEEVMEYIKFFSYQIYYMDVEITLFGIFSLNESLLLKVGSEMLSFFILFIQAEDTVAE